MKAERSRSRNVIIAILLAILAVLFYQTYTCLPAPNQAPTQSTHGYSVWSNQIFKSFMPGTARFCVPKDWQPLGAVSNDRGGATFPEGSTGILIKSAEFASTTVPLEKTDFELSVVFLKAMPETEQTAYVEIIKHAFNTVGTLYPPSTLPPQKHSVLISVGLAGDGNQFETSVYPNPSQYLSVFAKNRHNPRAEELFIHAATHAYNRFHPAFNTYQNNQSPLPAGDFEELEATWTELTFRSSSEALVRRTDDLYRTYLAVMNNQPTPGILYPLSNPQVFESITNKSVMVQTDATEGEAEFGHYIMAPLVFLSIEGMLADKKASTTVESLLKEVHQTNQNFFTLLAQHLDENEMALVTRSLTGETLLTESQVQRGLQELLK